MGGGVVEPGIIPAGAGRRRGPCGGRGGPWDHPRGCGEKARPYLAVRPGQGSSPRVRGEAERGWGGVAGAGIIPAGAGRSLLVNFALRVGRDHPRGCGEKPSSRSRKFTPSGSSPRVRGEGWPRRPRRPSRGIIPAGAGRSLPQIRQGCQAGDHPRGCGEKESSVSTHLREMGSSPRVRGEEVEVESPRRPPGIIPAGAGRRHTP